MLTEKFLCQTGFEKRLLIGPLNTINLNSLRYFDAFKHSLPDSILIDEFNNTPWIKLDGIKYEDEMVLSIQIKQFNKELLEKDKTCGELRQVVDSTKGEEKYLRAKLVESQNTISNYIEKEKLLEKSIADLTQSGANELNAYNGIINKLEIQIKQLNKELSEKDKTCDELRQVVDSTKNEEKYLRAKLVESQNTISNYIEKEKLLEKSIADLTQSGANELNAYNGIINKLEIQIKQLNKELLEKDKTCDELRQVVDSTKNEEKYLRAKLVESQNTISNYIEKEKLLEKSIADLTQSGANELNAYNGIINKLEIQIKQLNKELSEKDKTCDELRQVVDSTKNEEKYLRAKLVESQNTISNYIEKEKLLEKSIADLTQSGANELNAYNGIINKLEIQIKQLNKELLEKDKTCDELRQVVDSTKNEEKYLRAKLVESQNTISNYIEKEKLLEKSIADLTQSGANELNAYNGIINKLEIQIKQLNKKLLEKDKTCDELRQVVDSYTARVNESLFLSLVEARDKRDSNTRLLHEGINL
ncbi:putative leucine-rich repeat-containing protein DDB_G0290503 [Prorops nasuta]|uniref:putative leucine-rich repeat-containing protein DDB_G0290503 n=1 Tax=Prorops nasuta TaxID=863751 RepID=UPI0034CF1A2A